MPDFGAELDRYEHEVASRLGPEEAYDARREVAAHLLATYEARLEIGESKEEARVGALASIGDLRTAARKERRDPRDIALLLAAPLALLGWCLGRVEDAWWPEVLREVPAALQIVLMMSPASLAGLYGGLGRKWSGLRLLLKGWGVVFGASALPFGILASKDHSLGDAFEGMAFWGTGLALPGFVGLLVAIFFGRIDRMLPNDRTTRMLWAIRLLAPSAYFLLLTVALSARLEWLPRGVFWIYGGLVFLGMADRRRLDFRTLFGGVPLALTASVLWMNAATPGGIASIQPLPLQIAIVIVFVIGTSLVLQALALGIWALFRWVPRLRRGLV